MVEEIVNIIGKVVVFGGGASAIAFAALKLFGQKWFEHQFSQQLESFKREQSELLEQYKFQINSRFNRITKIHEKEFEVLPEIWHKLQDAYAHFFSIGPPFQQWPALNKYSDEQLDLFLKNCELHEFQKSELKTIEDKESYYRENSYWIRLSKARSVCSA